MARVKVRTEDQEKATYFSDSYRRKKLFDMFTRESIRKDFKACLATIL